MEAKTVIHVNLPAPVRGRRNWFFGSAKMAYKTLTPAIVKMPYETFAKMCVSLKRSGEEYTTDRMTVRAGEITRKSHNKQ